ncbi:hypothetical protein HCN44_009088, partial [Aphidius gifuensis]
PSAQVLSNTQQIVQKVTLSTSGGETSSQTSDFVSRIASPVSKAIPSTSYSQPSFPSQSFTINDIQESIGRVRRFMKKNKQHLQPRPVIVGPINKIESSYISIGGQLLPVLNPVHAVESMLKIYYALNIEYPPEGVTVWKFLASVIYDFKPQPPVSSAIPSVISELNVVAQKIRHGTLSS